LGDVRLSQNGGRGGLRQRTTGEFGSLRSKRVATVGRNAWVLQRKPSLVVQPGVCDTQSYSVSLNRDSEEGVPKVGDMGTRKRNFLGNIFFDYRGGIPGTSTKDVANYVQRWRWVYNTGGKERNIRDLKRFKKKRGKKNRQNLLRYPRETSTSIEENWMDKKRLRNPGFPLIIWEHHPVWGKMKRKGDFKGKKGGGTGKRCAPR